MTGDTALSMVVFKENIEMVKLLVEKKNNKGKRIVDVNIKSKSGETALTIAVGLDNFKMVQILAERTVQHFILH